MSAAGFNRVEPDSIARDGSVVAVGPKGQRAHRAAIEHGKLYERKLWSCGEHVWCLVGNGLSNQVFVEGPLGVIAIDTGESVEEMASALGELRRVCAKPVVAVIYSHFHYVSGTRALEHDPGTRLAEIPIWSHKGVVPNRQRVAGEFSPNASRGIVHQFGVLLPTDGEDALLHVGLGSFFRNPDHAPFTEGFVPPTHTFDTPTRVTLAGLEVELTPAPSDSNDSASIWFPSLKVAVNNLVWPCLFNVYPIRGEPYRDPTVLLAGIDHLRSLPIEHLVGAHGIPIAGRERVAADLTDYRDSIQFLWDQTVRGLNLGLTGSEIAHFVKMPERYGRNYLTRQMYGLAEHHLRQIRNGLVGWFDGDEATLFALPTGERAARLIQGFGGRETVRRQTREAIQADDLRWALELASWLVRATASEAASGSVSAGNPADRASVASGTGRMIPVAKAGDADHQLMGEVLRRIAQRTTSQNLRNWCLTRARELEGKLDLARFRRHRFREDEVLASPSHVYVNALRVLLDPQRAEGVEDELAWVFDDGSVSGLQIRSQVAVPSAGANAVLRLELSRAAWARWLAGKVTFDELLASGSLRLHGDAARIRRALSVFDHPSFRELSK